MPGLQRGAQLNGDSVVLDCAEHGEPEGPLGFEPGRIESVAGRLQIPQDVQEVSPQEVRQHEPVVQRRSPSDETSALGGAPEPADEGPDEQLLRQVHSCVRGHLEAAEFHKSQPARGAVRGVQLIDADFCPVGVAGHVGQKVAQQAIYQPRLGRVALARGRDHGEGDVEFVEGVVTRLVDPRRLARGTDEQAGEQIGQRGMTLPVGQQAAQDIGSA